MGTCASVIPNINYIMLNKFKDKVLYFKNIPMQLNTLSSIGCYASLLTDDSIDL